MPYIVRTYIIEDDTYHDKILAVFCDKKDAIDYIENNREKFDKDKHKDTIILEYWKKDILKQEYPFKYFDFKIKCI